MIATNGLNHLALPVQDPVRSARFYAGLFNMEIVSTSTSIAFVATAGGRDLLAFNLAESAVASGRNTLHFGFMVEPAQFDTAVREIERRGVPKISEPGERDIGRYIFIEDPDGYVVEIFENLGS